ncbi:uncharacterized protein LOC143571213 [Bidens hawaiensis]|uniref:uncharacterized protein LOC143571213 n=1 Tax=Bidens hawaiensis TaxID=980011 RepID=UPI0040499D65
MGLIINNEWCDIPKRVKNEVFCFFRDRFKEDRTDIPNLVCHKIKKLTEVDSLLLIAEFSKEEVKEAVFDCNGDRAPGPDGFNLRFFQRFWGLFEADFMEIMVNFHHGGKINKGCNASFIALIPKIGFTDRWCKWIFGIISSARSSVLVNGSPTFEFQCYKGLRQGDPISPFLFIIVMEAFSCMLRRANEVGVFNGIKTLRNEPTLSHLFYADDAMIMGEWSPGYVKNVARLLRDGGNRSDSGGASGGG